ncbi:MAG: prolyl oligopeptidase family serine peptidase [Candidatus Sulfotelmatobacter sp.]
MSLLILLSSLSKRLASYASKDGTSIPLFLAARKDLLHLRPLPTFLTGYGGFGSCVTPRFTAFATFLIEQGLLFAVPALRGGSELGEQWHRAGKRQNRQNSFDDFIAAAEWLLSEGRSTHGRIAIGGGSNAGLLVGATITQRPDELQSIYQSRLSARLGYVDEVQLLKTICDARAGKIVPLVVVFWTISLEFRLQDLAARGLLDAQAVPLSACRQREVPVSA